jgi:hypothetical protein
MNTQIEVELLRPLLEEIVTATIAKLEAERSALGARLAYSESEAAGMLGLAQHQLRDERLRGRVVASAIVGRRIRYMREDLVRYLLNRRWEAVARN